jgi:hypothetical protein
MRTEVLAAVNMKVTPCSLVNVHWRASIPEHSNIQI